MDPLSVASGVVGIVAFALQLGKTACKIKKAIEEIKSAPKEARELIERLVVLETTCQLISFHLERRETLPGHSPSTSPDIISKALAQCLVRIQDLEQVLLSSSLGDAVAGTRRLKFDTASRLRLVLRKERISSLIQEIDRVISLLQFVIQVDMWSMTATPLQLLPPTNHSKSLMDNSFKPGKFSNTTLVNIASSQSTVARSFRQPTNQKRRTFRYLRYVTWTVTDGWTGDERDEGDDVSLIAHRKGSIAIRLPFTSTQLNMHYYSSMGTPSYALNVSHVIEEHTELGNQLWAAMSGDPERLHRLISGRQLSLYSLLKTRSGEINLFFIAVGSRWAEGCKYLLQHDFRHQFLQSETPPYMFGGLQGLSEEACEVTEMVLSMRPYEMLETDIKYLLDTQLHPEYFSRYSKVFLKSPGVDNTVILSYAWDRLVTSLCLCLDSIDDVSSYIPAFQYLIEQGVDIHEQICGPESAYGQLLGGAMHPFDADEIACSWLKILKACGIDICSYVKTERSLIERNGFGQYSNTVERKIVVLDFEGLPMLSWRWELPTDSDIIEVLEEFRHLGCELMEPRMRGICPSGPEDFKRWNDGYYCRSWGEDCFPFRLAPINCIEGLDDYRLDDLWCRETYIRAVELRDRRQAKKWRKLHPWERPPSHKMPGTWVD